MDITRENTGDLNAVLTVKIGKTDYEKKVENILKDYTVRQGDRPAALSHFPL